MVDGVGNSGITNWDVWFVAELGVIVHCTCSPEFLTHHTKSEVLSIAFHVRSCFSVGFAPTHVGRQRVAQGSEIGVDVLVAFSLELDPASHSSSFVLFLSLALFATMQGQSPSHRSHKSSLTSGSSRRTKKRATRKGSHPEKANKDLTMVKSEATGAMSSDGASAFVALTNVPKAAFQESMTQDRKSVV